MKEMTYNPQVFLDWKGGSLRLKVHGSQMNPGHPIVLSPAMQLWSWSHSYLDVWIISESPILNSSLPWILFWYTKAWWDFGPCGAPIEMEALSLCHWLSQPLTSSLRSLSPNYKVQVGHQPDPYPMLSINSARTSYLNYQCQSTASWCSTPGPRQHRWTISLVNRTLQCVYINHLSRDC